MTLPEDVREQVESCIAVDLRDVTHGEESTFYIDDLIELVISAKAEGYQEGVKAMRDAALASLITNSGETREDFGPTWRTKRINERADQLLNPEI